MGNKKEFSQAVQAPADASALVDDKWIAEQLRLSPATIRVQRYLRRHGAPHWLQLDPVLVGTVPRYRRADVVAWINSLTTLATSARLESADCARIQVVTSTHGF